MNTQAKVFAGAISIVICSLILPVRTTAQSYTNPREYAVGRAPGAVCVGDFNADSKLDLAVANFESDNVSVLLGNGDGTFQDALNYTVADAPRFVTVGDFNGDRHVDLAVATGSTVSILLGTGDGTFQPPTQYSAGTRAQYVVAANFTGDHKLDLLVSNDQGTISILLGNGDGTFQPPVTTSTEGSTPFVAVGDFNEDGHLDVVTGNGGVKDEQDSGTLIVLLGNGDGTFRSPATVELPFWPKYFTSADLNGDGKTDLAAAVRENVFAGDIRILLGNGDGTFEIGSTVKGEFSFAVATADLNNDGKLDLIGIEDFDPENHPMEIQMMLGNGDGTFQDATFNPCAQSSGCIQIFKRPTWLAIADFNGDTLPELVVANSDDNSVSVLLNVGNTANPLPSFSLSVASANLTIQGGGQASDLITVASQNESPSDTVGLSCAVTGPSPLPTCALSPETITLAAKTASSTLTITVPDTATLIPFHHESLALLLALCLSLTGIVCLGTRTAFRKSRRPSLSFGLLCGLSIALCAMQAACGGASGGSPSRTSQEYIVSVTATAGSVQHSTMVTVNVQ